MLSTHSRTPAAGVNGDDAVRAHAQLTLARREVVQQKTVDELEELLHDGVLSQVVVAGFGELLVRDPVAAERLHELGLVDAPDQTAGVGEALEVREPSAYRIVGSTGRDAVTIGTRCRSLSARFLHWAGIWCPPPASPRASRGETGCFAKSIYASIIRVHLANHRGVVLGCLANASRQSRAASIFSRGVEYSSGVPLPPTRSPRRSACTWYSTW